MIKAFAALAALASVASALPKPSNANTAMRFIYHNNLNLTDDVNHVGAILLSTPMPYSQAADACGALNENLLNKRTLQQYRADFAPELSYLSYSNFIEMNTQAYFIGDNGVVIATEGLDNFKVRSIIIFAILPLSVLSSLLLRILSTHHSHYPCFVRRVTSTMKLLLPHPRHRISLWFGQQEMNTSATATRRASALLVSSMANIPHAGHTLRHTT
jgi:hypothetical protein